MLASLLGMEKQWPWLCVLGFQRTYIGDNNLVWIIVAKDVFALFCSSKKTNIWLENGHLKVWHMDLTYATSWQAVFIPCRLPFIQEGKVFQWSQWIQGRRLTSFNFFLKTVDEILLTAAARSATPNCVGKESKRNEIVTHKILSVQLCRNKHNSMYCFKGPVL